jgi:hypothetical protein
MKESNPTHNNDSGSAESERWFCPNCKEFRYLDGSEGYRCDPPRDCPSESFGEQNCGYVVCSECHTPLSDRHLAPGSDLL